MPAIDPFFASNIDPVTAARHAEAVTPSDTADLNHVTSAIYIGGAGNLALILANDSAPVTFTGLAAGTVLQVQAKRIMATNTTATALLAMWS